MIFKDEERNNRLRNEILNYFISSVMTDDERADVLGLPKGCRIRERAKIISQEKFACGEFVWIGEGAILDASGGLSVGSHTTIGAGVYVWTHTSFLSNLTMNNVMDSPLIRRERTTIGGGCYIVGPTVVYAGVTIGDRVKILPMSVVNRDIPSNTIYAGSPARKIGDITDEYIEEEIARTRRENENDV